MHSSRPVLALLHGWGMNARVFDTLAEMLAAHFDVMPMSLPGHGGRASLPGNDLQTWGDDVAGQLPSGAILLGWSLGGQVAMRAALDHPQTIGRLILLASTPRFVAAADWVHGIASPDLEAFGTALFADADATLLRFLSLQTRGMAGQKALLQDLRQAFRAVDPADHDALAAGLAILRDTDLRGDVARLTQPTLVLHGALDTLTPAGAGAWLAEHVPHAVHVKIERAAHAPHLSHVDAVATAIGRFAHA